MKKIVSIILTLIILSGTFTISFAKDLDINQVIADTASYIYKTVSEPQIGSIGGEWAVLGLARSDVEIPEDYFENYYQMAEKYLKDREGVLHSRKYTEYSRTIIALTSIDKNPQDVAGYNLLTPLGDYEKTIWQGINGAIWALIALDCGNYDIPKNPDAKTQATREMYINYILEKQTSDGGWALSGDAANADITAMALQALSKYQDNDTVKSATAKALDCLSDMQNENGGFSSYETENTESSVQVIVALCELGISVYDERFVKNGKSVYDNLITFYDRGKGFKHTHTEDTNQMTTEQCFYALVALKRANENKTSLYDMSDVVLQDNKSDIIGPSKKHADVRKMNIIYPGRLLQILLDIGKN